jgi:hypothetical protein
MLDGRETYSDACPGQAAPGWTSLDQQSLLKSGGQMARWVQQRMQQLGRIHRPGTPRFV